MLEVLGPVRQTTEPGESSSIPAETDKKDSCHKIKNTNRHTYTLQDQSRAFVFDHTKQSALKETIATQLRVPLNPVAGLEKGNTVATAH